LYADGEVHPAEGKLLGRILKACGDPFDFGVDMQPKQRGADAAKALAELPDDVRKEAFELVIEAAVVDGKVDPAEQRYLEPIAAAMGWTAEQLDERIAERLMDG
jgi:tellurite resistance protein